MKRQKGKTLPKKPVPLPIPKTKIFALGQQFENDLDKSLFYFTYLTGARASEVIQVETNDFEKVFDQGKEQWKVNVHTLKRRDLTSGFPFRNLPLKGSTDIELKMLELILRHKITFEKHGIQKMFEFNRKTLWKKFSAIKFPATLVHFEPLELEEGAEQHLYPHFLRHCRATDLVQDYGFGPFDLQYFMGWSSLDVAAVYVSLDWRHASRLLLGLQQQIGSNPVESVSPTG